MDILVDMHIDVNVLISGVYFTSMSSGQEKYFGTRLFFKVIDPIQTNHQLISFYFDKICILEEFHRNLTIYCHCLSFHRVCIQSSAKSTFFEIFPCFLNHSIDNLND